MSQSDWIWMPHPAHFICSRWCQYHLATYVNGYIISTIGEYFPDRDTRRINIKIHLQSHTNDQEAKEILDLKGDFFDLAYRKKFGYERLGSGENDLYETYVFTAKQREEIVTCCPYEAATWNEIEGKRWDKPEIAYMGHINFCKKYDKIERKI